MKLKNLGDKFNVGRRAVVDDSDYTPMLGVAGSNTTVETKEESWFSIIGGWAKGIILTVLSAAVFVALIYSLLAVFLMMFIPVDNQGGERGWVIRGTWQESGGIPDVGDEAVVSMSKDIKKTEWYDLIVMGFIGVPDVAVVKNLSADDDKLYINKDEVTNLMTKEKFSNFTGSALFQYDLEDPEQKTELNYQLDHSILVECVSGACEPGSVFILDKNQIFGERK